MAHGLVFQLAPFCGEAERYTWQATPVEGLDHAELGNALARAGFRVRLDTTSLRLLESPTTALVTLRAGQPVQVRVAMGLPLEAREPALRDEEARINAILGFVTDPGPAAAASAAELDLTISAMIDERVQVIQDIYLGEDAPLVVGYSGGKDSTATLMLVWEALRRLPLNLRTKTVHVVSTDTGVENPVVARMAEESLEAMRRAAGEQGLPVEVRRLQPTTEDSFWTMVLGRGYAVPRPLFRWCTSRLKIAPANAYVVEFVEREGGVIQVLGTRKTESAARARTMERHQAGRTRPFLSPNGSLKLEDGRRKEVGASAQKAWILSPIEDWSTELVWTYLNRVENPWGFDNAHVTGMYASASDASECPMTLDASQGDAPSCGKSRFGCWVCTMVAEEKSLTSFLVNDRATYGWLQPLLDLRNRLSPRQGDSTDAWSDGALRSHYRVQEDRYYLFHELGKHIKGRYIQSHREDLLRGLLTAQVRIQAEGPDWARSFELISIQELEAIRDLWINLWNEVEDNLPVIYEEVLGRPYPGPARKPLLRDIRARIAALRVAAEEEAEALGQDARMLFEQAREVLVMKAKRTKSGTDPGRPLSTDEIYHRHQVHSPEEADGLALRETSRRQSIKRVLAAAEGKGVGALSVFDVSIDLGGIAVAISEVVAAAPAEAVQIAAAGWAARHSDHVEAWGLTLEELMAGATATWRRTAGKGEPTTDLTPEPAWWSVRFDQLGRSCSLLVKASHAHEAVALAAQEATDFADVLAVELDLDVDQIPLLVADDWDDPPIARLRDLTDAEALPHTLRMRARVARAALVAQPGLFDLVADRRETRGFLRDWLEEEWVGVGPTG